MKATVAGLFVAAVIACEDGSQGADAATARSSPARDEERVAALEQARAEGEAWLARLASESAVDAGETLTLPGFYSLTHDYIPGDDGDEPLVLAPSYTVAPDALDGLFADAPRVARHRPVATPTLVVVVDPAGVARIESVGAPATSENGSLLRRDPSRARA